MYGQNQVMLILLSRYLLCARICHLNYNGLILTGILVAYRRYTIQWPPKVV